MGVGIYYFYHGFVLKAFEGRHIRIININKKIIVNIHLRSSDFIYNFLAIVHAKKSQIGERYSTYVYIYTIHVYTIKTGNSKNVIHSYNNMRHLST